MEKVFFLLDSLLEEISIVKVVSLLPNLILAGFF